MKSSIQEITPIIGTAMGGGFYAGRILVEGQPFAITLDAIKAEHAKVAEMIALFEAQSSETTEIHFPEFLVELKHGEEYAGLIVGKDGEASYHLVLIPGQADSINWPDAKAWSVKQGGELPTLREQSLLFANLNEQFEEAYYWSGEQHASDSDCAWSQSFYNGRQHGYTTSGKLRARAVRRLIIQ